MLANKSKPVSMGVFKVEKPNGYSNLVLVSFFLEVFGEGFVNSTAQLGVVQNASGLQLLAVKIQ